MAMKYDKSVPGNMARPTHLLVTPIPTLDQNHCQSLPLDTILEWFGPIPRREYGNESEAHPLGKANHFHVLLEPPRDSDSEE